MTTLSDRVLRGGKDPDYDFLKNFIIRGGGDVIEDKLKEQQGWDGVSPVASVGIHVGEDGSIKDTEIFLMGSKEVGRVSSSTLFGNKFGCKTLGAAPPRFCSLGFALGQSLGSPHTAP